jgi:hypothetical protein
VQNWNQTLVHVPWKVEQRQHVEWRRELQLLSNLAYHDGKNAVDDAGFGALFFWLALPTRAVEPVHEAAACSKAETVVRARARE